ncbi:MAG TPA: hypothetical protein PKC69_06685 [Chitinophagaceae bacterium]|nr:hypothetical protein [Chitinophagaceae bacterium]
MRKILFFAAAGAIATLLINCTASRKAGKAKPVITYASQVQPVLQASCAPCHFPDKGGRKKAYDNIEVVKQDIDEIIRRISLSPSEKGFMPFKNPKLSDSTIAIFRQWKEDGLQ